MISAVEFKSGTTDYSIDIAADMGVEKDAKGGRESEGKVDPRIARGEQLLASIQSAQGRGADQGNDINALTDEALGLGNDILNNTPPSGSGADSYLQGLKNLGVLNTGIVTMAAVMLLLQEHANATFEAMTTKTEISREAQDMANRVKALLAKLTKPEDKAELPPEVIQYMRENNILVEGKTIDEFLAGAGGGGLSGAEAQLALLDSMIAQAGPTGMESRHWQSVVKFMDDNGIRIGNGQKASDWIWGLPEVGMKPGQKVSLEHMKELRDTLAGAMKPELDQGSLKAVEMALESASGRASDFVQQTQLKLQQLMQNYNTAVQMTNSLQSMLAESVKSIASSIR
ncbi:secretion protein EspA [Pseudomonas chlororaphis]|uniref:secretion protein EspA n=1 Tax=Pseudomonas chlororaphis TaxID=587753 RepID=UPI0015DDF560|nr:secretion protein EspA [Pseudomonas chlororaphis]QLL13456.1 secretion protein EspA [Pseudomonas chlororaphis subsp. aurantiaca]